MRASFSATVSVDVVENLDFRSYCIRIWLCASLPKCPTNNFSNSSRYPHHLLLARPFPIEVHHHHTHKLIFLTTLLTIIFLVVSSIAPSREAINKLSRSTSNPLSNLFRIKIISTLILIFKVNFFKVHLWVSFQCGVNNLGSRD